MGSIFDDNSEFLEYLKSKKQDSSPSNEEENNLYFKATPFESQQKEPEEPKTQDTDPLKDSSLFDPSKEKEDHTELHIQEKSPKETFTLNLKHLSLKQTEDVQKDTPSPSVSPPLKKESLLSSKDEKKLKELNVSKSTLANFIWDKISFIATTFAIFLVFFFLLNWSAYSQILMNKYQDFTGQLDDSPLQSFVQTDSDTEDLAYQEPNEISNSPFAVNHFSIPMIELEVVPPGIRIIIPRINKNVPVINVSDDKLLAKDWSSLEADIQDSLKAGVVHYPGTPWPDQSGNVVLTGHSSYYPWDPGRFKDVFALLHNVQLDDQIILFYKQKRYSYQVDDIKVVLPSEVNVLGDSGDDRITLITCTPVGTNLRRLIVTAKPI